VIYQGGNDKMASAGEAGLTQECKQEQNRKLIGQAIIDGLLTPSGLVFASTYSQTKGGYWQGDGGTHTQSEGDYHQGVVKGVKSE
jgi:hypothetical protein